MKIKSLIVMVLAGLLVFSGNVLAERPPGAGGGAVAVAVAVAVASPQTMVIS